VTLLPEVRDQLLATARRRAAGAAATRLSPSRLRTTLGAAGLAVSALVVVGVVAAILLTAHGTPSADTPAVAAAPNTPPTGWGKLYQQAAAQTQAHDHVCRPVRLTGPSPVRNDAPGPILSSALGVLRHPAPPSQQVSPSQLRKAIGGGTDRFARGVYLRYARHGQVNDVRYFLIPATNVNEVRAIPSRCYDQQLTAFRADTAHLSIARRTALVTYEARWLHAQHNIAQHPAGVCLTYAGGGVSGFGGCLPATSINELPGPLGSGGNNRSTITALIVPDRVATVSAHYTPQTYPGRVPRALTVTQHARDNIVIFNFQGAWDPPTLTMRSAAGAILWSSRRR
jgi:hypothetical protein